MPDPHAPVPTVDPAPVPAPAEALAQFLLKSLGTAADPEAALERALAAGPTLLRLLRPGAAPRLSGGRVTVAATGWMLGGTLVFWLGALTGQLWLPALGFALGTAGAAGMATGFARISDRDRRFLFLKAAYACLLLVENADGVCTERERRQLEEFIAALPLADDQRRELLAMPVPTLPSLPLPDFLDVEQKKTIVTACWSLAYCDGVAAPEVTAVGQVAGRLGLAPAECERLRLSVVQALDEAQEKLLCSAAQASALLPEIPQREERLLRLLVGASSRNDPPEQMRQELVGRARHYTPDASATLPVAVLAGAYIVVKALLEDDPKALITADIRFREMATRRLQGELALRLQLRIGELFARLLPLLADPAPGPAGTAPAPGC